MRRRAILLVFVPFVLAAQNPADIRRLNSIVVYANQSAAEVNSVTQAVVAYHSALKGKSASSWPGFICPVQPDEYYLKKALEESLPLGDKAASVQKAFNDLKNTAGLIDLKCKALDTYHKLEDHRKDEYAQGKKIIEELVALLDGYHSKQESLRDELSKRYAHSHVAHAYDKTTNVMRLQLDRERKFMDLWKYNLNEEEHTLWIEEKLSESILETADEIKKMEGMKPILKYPASGMWPSFLEGMRSVLKIKRMALDEYNHEARKSDLHANATYLDLINYYNGVLVADYNAFLDYASNDQFYGIKAIAYVPALAIRQRQLDEKPAITSFKDEPVSLPALQRRPGPISVNEFAALENYVDFINESFRQVSHQRDVIHNLSSRASYFASLTSFSGRGSIQFSHDRFSIPMSFYQKAVSESNVLDPEVAAALNMHARGLLAILQEVDQIGIKLEEKTTDKSYERDACKELYKLIERTKVLYDTWDLKKETLYQDLSKVFASFPVPQREKSWTKSAAALRELTELDREALFIAKAYYRNESTERPATGQLDEKTRDVLANQYGNLEGIQKLGRNNGRCPYTPYEDLPKSSRYLSEAFNALKPVRAGQSRYQHPYHTMVYHYNDVVRHLNKFAELSPVPLLKTVLQPELFEIEYPNSGDVKSDLSDDTPTVKSAASIPSKPLEQPARRDDGNASTPNVQLVRDTIYIERRDTVYISEASGDLRSMEGYASNNLILLLDVSGSMNSQGKLPILKESVLQLLDMMREEDQIAIVVFSGRPSVLLKPVSFRYPDKIRKAIRSLKPSGKTDANAGLKLAYKVADENYIRGGNNRIILATDGEFSINEESRNLIGRFADQDIFLSVFDFGKAKSTSANLSAVATKGRGTYQFISRENAGINLIREVKARRK